MDIPDIIPVFLEEEGHRVKLLKHNRPHYVLCREGDVARGQWCRRRTPDGVGRTWKRQARERQKFDKEQKMHVHEEEEKNKNECLVKRTCAMCAVHLQFHPELRATAKFNKNLPANSTELVLL